MNNSSSNKVCATCKLGVFEQNKKCPLCRREVVDNPDENLENSFPSQNWYPSYDGLIIKKPSHFLLKLFAFITISAICILVVINLLTGGEFWFLYIIPSLLYAWLTAFHTILSHSHLGSKIVVQVFGISFLLGWINIVNGGIRWSVNYVVPFLVVAATILIGIISLTKRMRRRAFTGYLIALIFLGIVPIILFAFGLSKVLWPAVVSALVSLITFIGMWIFTRKNMKNELGKMFHF